MQGNKKGYVFMLFIMIVLVSACSQETSKQETKEIPEDLPSLEDLDPNDPMTPYAKYGEENFNKTSTVLPEKTGNELSYASCHADGGASSTIRIIQVTKEYHE